MINYTIASEALDYFKMRGFTLDSSIGLKNIKTDVSSISMTSDKFDIASLYQFQDAKSPNEEPSDIRDK
jgi:hypothetical protein